MRRKRGRTDWSPEEVVDEWILKMRNNGFSFAQIQEVIQTAQKRMERVKKVKKV